MSSGTGDVRCYRWGWLPPHPAPGHGVGMQGEPGDCWCCEEQACEGHRPLLQLQPMERTARSW